MKTSYVSSHICHWIRVMICVTTIAGFTSQAFAQQPSRLPSRTGMKQHAPQPAVRTAPSTTKGESSPLYTFTFGVIAFPRSQISVLCGINDSGRMVGGYNDTNLEIYTADHGYELKGNTFSTIDYPGAQQTEVEAINKKGEMVGDFVDASGNQHGFKLAGGTYTQLDFPGTVDSQSDGTIGGAGVI